MKTNPQVDKYIEQFPSSTQKILKKIRAIVKKTCKDAEESISYGMPAYKLNGKPVVYFAGWKSHVGIYATPSAHTAFKKELSGFVNAKGSVKFPLDKPIPYEIVERMIEFNIKKIHSNKI